MNNPGWRLHTLHGADLKGHWSVWVNGNWLQMQADYDLWQAEHSGRNLDVESAHVVPA